MRGRTMTDDARIATGNLRVNANDPIPTDYAERAKGMGVSIINGGAAFRVLSLIHISEPTRPY